MMFQVNDPYWLLTERGYFELVDTAALLRTVTPEQMRVFASKNATSAINATRIDANGEPQVFFDDEDDDDDLDEDGEFGRYGDMIERHGNVALVHVTGKIASTDHWLLRLFGITSYPAIVNALTAVADHPEIKAAIVVYNSPGGSAMGADDAATEMSRINREELPIYSYNAGQMCSGAMWLGSTGREIAGGRLSISGSIGVLAVHQDMSKMLKERGITSTVLTIGERKADGNPYEPLSEPARNQILAEMQGIFDVFGNVAASNLGLTFDEIVKQQAATYLGQSAVEHGLMHKIMPLNRFIESVASRHEGDASFGPSEGRSTSKVSVMTGKNKPKVSAGGGTKQTMTQLQKDALAAGRTMEDVMSDPKLQAETAPKGGEGAQGGEGGEGEEEDGEEEEDDEEEGEEEEGEEGDKGQKGGKKAAAKKPASSVASKGVYARLENALTENAELKAEKNVLDNRLKKLTANTASLVKVTVEATRRMQVAMGGVPTVSDDMDAETALSQYDRTVTAFNNAFKVGASAQAATTQNLHEEGEDTGQPLRPNPAAVRFKRTGNQK